MKKVHLIRTAGMDRELFQWVLDLLRAVPGPIVFEGDPDAPVAFREDELHDMYIPDQEGFEQQCMEHSLSRNHWMPPTFPLHRPSLRWETLFGRCEAFRRHMRIHGNDYVLLLSDIGNRMNWFATLDRNMPRNGFIHTDEWEHYIDCPAAFPIAFETVALLLQGHIFGDDLELRKSVHLRPIGCVNDMCVQKTDIILKMRTADVCRNCLAKLQQHMPAPIIRQCLDIMESLRVKMLYAQNFRQGQGLSRLIVDARMNITLPDFGNIRIRLRPIEKALYRLFLDHPEGIRMIDLHEHRETLHRYYRALSQNDDPDTVRKRIDTLVNILKDTADQHISRIKRNFVQSLGQDLAEEYIIAGARNEPYRIRLDLKWVSHA